MNIKDYEDYLIFEDGDVFSIKRNIFLKPLKNTTGYLIVDLSKNNKRKRFSIHRLIALHYIPNPDNKPCIDHKDRNRLNNNISNLRWVTYSENNINTTYRKNNKLKERNIKKTTINTFQVKIVRNKLTYTKSKKTLQEAKIQRDLMLSMFNGTI